MAVVIDILENERTRLVKLLSKYESKLSELPKGSISIKKRSRREYAYLAYRENKKVVFDYIGPASSDAVRKLGQEIERRKELEQKIRQVKQNLRTVERSLRAGR
jgi:hypothetical protein